MNIIEKTETDSTNDDAKLLANNGAPNYTVVWAHKQLAGRGRHDRKWISIEGNVFWSIVIRPDARWFSVSDIVFVNALAVRSAIAACVGMEDGLSLKWPNDVLLNGKKVAGSLIETGGSWAKGTPEWVVIGTGINVVQSPPGAGLRYPATNLHEAGFNSVTREFLVCKLNEAIQAGIDAWLRGGFNVVRKEYLARAHALNEAIRVGLSPDKSDYTDGIYRGIDAIGNLMLEVEGGKTIHLNSADVLLRTN